MTVDAGRAGTTPTPDGSAAGATGTGAGAGRDSGGQPTVEELQAENARLKQEKQQHLSEKTGFERDRQELEELRAGRTTPTTEPGGTRQDERAREVWEKVMENARAGDPESIAIIQGMESLHGTFTQKISQLEAKIEALTVPEAERGEVEKAYKTGKFKTYDAAREHVRKEGEVAELRERIRKLEAGEGAPEPTKKVNTFTPSGGGGGGGPEIPPDMPRSTYLAKMEDDNVSYEEKVALRRRRDSGKLVLKE